MFYDRNSEDLDLPRFNPDDSKPIEQKENDEETQKNMKNKRLIIIAIIAGIILLALIIFLIVYFSLKKMMTEVSYLQLMKLMELNQFLF